MNRYTYRTPDGSVLLTDELDGRYTANKVIDELAARLAAFEDLDMTPDDIEQTMLRFSSFLMEMTGGRMSKTNYTVQAMVSEANDHFESICDECSDRQHLAEVEKELERLKQELIDERHRHDRLQDFEVAEAQELARVKAELDATKKDILKCCKTCAKSMMNNGTGLVCRFVRECSEEYEHWEWRGAKDTNVPSKEEV